MRNGRRATSMLLVAALLPLAGCGGASEGDIAFCTYVIEAGPTFFSSAWRNRDWIEDGELLGTYVAAIDQVSYGGLNREDAYAKVVGRCAKLGVR